MRLAPVALLALAACQGDLYVIPAGDHASTNAVRLLTDAEQRITVLFDDSAVYATVDPANQGDINKLWGTSDCSSHHHEASARLGWRWYGGALQIHAYTYVDGVRDSELLGEVDLYAREDMAIALVDDTYVFTFAGAETVMPRGCDGSGGARYQLWPYFGGDETAPHDVSILVEER